MNSSVDIRIVERSFVVDGIAEDGVGYWATHVGSLAMAVAVAVGSVVS